MFTAIRGVPLKALKFHDPDRLATIRAGKSGTFTRGEAVLRIKTMDEGLVSHWGSGG